MKKFLVVALLLSALALPVSAEQPAAEQYRQMFSSGNFYVEYQMYGLNNEKERPISGIMAFAGQNGDRMYRPLTGKIIGFVVSMMSGTMNNHLKMLSSSKAICSNIYSNLEFRQPETVAAEKKCPDVMYHDGKYYRFLTLENHVAAIVLKEEELNSPYLNPKEEWNFIREDLALPDELAIFCWDEPFRDNVTNAPRYNGSSKREVAGKEYDCDQYVGDIKNLAGTIAFQEVYNALYDGGKLARVQKYIIHDGKELFIQGLVIKNLTAQVPDSAFKIGRKVKVYAADKCDMNDLLEQPELVETLGGK